jgi:hypothetical protein
VHAAATAAPAPGSERRRRAARSAQFRFDLAVGRRLRRKPDECLVEEVHGLFAVALPAMDHAEVGHDSGLVLLVAELAKDGQRLL